MMSSARRQRRFFRRGSLVLVLLVLSLSALTTAVALAVTRHEPQQVRTARGVVDGSFHPIAGKFTPDKTQLGDCHAGDVRCFEQSFGNLAYQEGPKPALALLRHPRAAPPPGRWSLLLGRVARPCLGLLFVVLSRASPLPAVARVSAPKQRLCRRCG